MDEGTRALWRRRLLFLGWIFLGATIVAAFFVAAFFSSISAIAIGDPGAIILLVPLLTGFLLGVLLTDAEIVAAAAAGVLCAGFAVTLVAIFLVSPILAGVAALSTPFAGFSISSAALTMIVLFPLIVVGTVLGRGIGDLFLPSPRAKRQAEQLREETRRWHESLGRQGHHQQDDRETILAGTEEWKD